MVKKVKKKKMRKRKRNNVKHATSSDMWSLYHVNVNNLDSRYLSLKSILANNKYSVVTINETHLQSQRKVELPDYLTYSTNRVERNAGGIATAVEMSDAANCVRVEVGTDNNEYIVTRHDQFEVPINVINM